MEFQPIQQTEPARPLRDSTRSGSGTSSKPETTANANSTSTSAGGVSAGPDTEGVLPTQAKTASDSSELRENASRTQQEREASAQQATDSELSRMIAQLSREARRPGNSRLSIEIDQENDMTRFLVIHRETGDVLKEIPEVDLNEVIRNRPEIQSILVDRRL